MKVMIDTDTEFSLASPTMTDRTGKPLFAAAVQVRKSYVSYHLMPIYMNPALMATVSAALRKRMQGKACFNFKTIEPSEAKELATLTKKGLAGFKESAAPLGWEWEGSDPGLTPARGVPLGGVRAGSDPGLTLPLPSRRFHGPTCVVDESRGRARHGCRSEPDRAGAGPTEGDAEFARAAYDTYRSMVQSSPYRSLAWQYLGPTNISGRATDIAVADTRRRAAHLRRLRDERRLEDRRRRRDVAGGLRESAVDEHRRHRRRAVEPGHRLGRHRRGQHVPRLDGRASASTSRPTAARTFQHMGLTDTQTIARIVVHPTNPDIVYVAAVGHEWTDNEMRGVFKTTDGGRTWTKVLYRSPRTGAIDLVMDPSDPEHALRRDVAARPPQVERPARRARLQRRRHLEDDRRRARRGRTRAQGLPRRAVPRPHRHRRRRARTRTCSTRSSTTTRTGRPPREGERDAYGRPIVESRIKAAEVYRTDDKGRTWRKVSASERLHDRATPAPTAGCSGRSASIRPTRTRSTRWASA